MTGESGDRFNYFDMAVDFITYSTDATKDYAEVIALQVLGHALGHDVINEIAPFAVYHNMYSLLIGPSTLSRKTTVQDLFKMIYPQERCLPNEGSPEAMLEALSKQNEGFIWMGEFSKLLKGIKSGGYMSGFAETLNDLFSCQRFVRMLRSKKDTENVFEIEKPYLSISSTITPEVLKANLTREMADGGLMARYLLVNCDKPKTRPRTRLKRRAKTVKDMLKTWIQSVLDIEKNGKFVLTDDALQYFNEVVEVGCDKYSRVSAYGGRYQNYVIAFADVLLVSEALAKVDDYDGQLANLVELVTLVKLVDSIDGYIKEQQEETNRSYPANATNLTNHTNFGDVMFVQKRHIEQAWKIIKPCLEYANDLITYVDMGKSLAKCREYIKKFDCEWVNHSDLMRMTNLSAKEVQEAISTLLERDEIEIFNEKNVSSNGRVYVTKKYQWKKLSVNGNPIDTKFITIKN